MNIDKHTYRMWCHGNQIWVLPFDADFLVSPAESITSTAHRCAGHHLRPSTTLYLRENNASREFASVGGWDPKIPRLQGQKVPLWVDYIGTSGPTSSGLGQEWSSVRIPNGRMIGFLFKHGDMSISLWHWQGLVEGECQEATGRTDLSIRRSGIYPLNFDRIAPMGCTTS